MIGCVNGVIHRRTHEKGGRRMDAIFVVLKPTFLSKNLLCHCKKGNNDTKLFWYTRNMRDERVSEGILEQH